MKLSITKAYGVHIFTAIGILAGFASLIAIQNQQYPLFFLYNALAIVIDSVDGLLARKVKVKIYAPQIDGALMDNIIDFLTYTIAPAFFIYQTQIIPPQYILITLTGLLLSSTLQFSNNNAKTAGHFFLGFPSYWNLLVFFLFIWNLTPHTNLLITWFCIILSFIPIKFIYPSRIDYLSPSKSIRITFTILTLLWGFTTLGMILTYPRIPTYLHLYNLIYIVIYTGFSLKRTFQSPF